LSRKNKAVPREIIPDRMFGSLLAAKFINCLMTRGKKSTAERAFYSALTIVSEKIKDNESIAVFTQAIENIKPLLEVKSRRVGGANYQVPSKSRPAGARRSRSAGCSRPPAAAARRPSANASPTSCSTLSTRRALRCANARKCTAWPRPTRPSPTTAGRPSGEAERGLAWPQMRQAARRIADEVGPVSSERDPTAASGCLETSGARTSNEVLALLSSDDDGFAEASVLYKRTDSTSRATRSE